MNTNMKTYTQNETPDFEMIRAAAPEEEGARQYYFIEQAKKLWKQQFFRRGRQWGGKGALRRSNAL